MHRRSGFWPTSLLAVTFFSIPNSVLAKGEKDAAALRDRVEHWRKINGASVIRELAEFVALPNLASDQAGIQRNARHLLGLLQRHGIEGRLFEERGAPPVVYGELRFPEAKRTVVFYAHYDGQPVDATQWVSAPWTAVLRDKPLEQEGKEIPLPMLETAVDDEARLYGRSTSDDKGAIVAMLAAVDALRAARLTPSINLKFYFEGEEEAGSPHLRSFLENLRDQLQADAWIFCDGPVHQSRAMQVAYGARGSLGAEVTIYGATRALHSGHYGNWAPNPATLLATLLASMRDSNGRITITGFSDPVRPLTEIEQRAVEAIPNIDSELRQSLGLAHTEAGDAPIAERVVLPALNVRGLLSGRVGEQAANAIPTEARASIDFRLVPDQTPEGVKTAVEGHLRAQGYKVVHEAPTASSRFALARIARVDWSSGYPGLRTPMDLPFSRAVASVVREAVRGPIVQVPNLGGSLPLFLFHDVLEVPVLIVPIANHDNNQHAANENLRVRNLWDGIDVFAALFLRLGDVWTTETRAAFKTGTPNKR